MAEKLIGEITHYYSGIEVGIIKLFASLKKGTKLHFKGATTDFIQVADSMQYNHQDIDVANARQELGLKVADKVREGDQVFLADPNAKIGPVPKIKIAPVVKSQKKVADKKKIAKKSAKKIKKAAKKKVKKAIKSKKTKKVKKAKKSKKEKK